MSETITGGPAFPIECHIAGGYRADEGLTMRDYFAGQALVALGTWMPVPEKGYPSLSSDETIKARAEIAYRHADAMLAHKYATDPKPPSLDDDRPF